MKESSFSRARTIVRQLSRTVLLATFIVATTADAFTATYHVIHRFTGGIDGGGAYAGVVFDAAGNLYGTAVSGGSGDGRPRWLTTRRQPLAMVHDGRP